MQQAGEAELSEQQVTDSPGLSAQEASTPSLPFRSVPFPLGIMKGSALSHLQRTSPGRGNTFISPSAIYISA